MSNWQSYLELILKGEGVKSAGIFGQEGDNWASSGELKLSGQEVKDLCAGLKDSSKFRAAGMVAAGGKYMFVKDLSATSAVGRKGSSSLIAIATKKALIVVTTKDGMNPDRVTSHESVANELIKKGF